MHLCHVVAAQERVETAAVTVAALSARIEALELESAQLASQNAALTKRASASGANVQATPPHPTARACNHKFPGRFGDRSVCSLKLVFAVWFAVYSHSAAHTEKRSRV